MNADHRGAGRPALHLSHPTRPVGDLPPVAAVPDAGPRLAMPPLRPCASWPPTTLVRVLLCEDQEVFRLGLRVVLEAQPDMAVVAETAHLPEALEAAVDQDVQVVIARQGLVGGATLPLLHELCESGVAVLVLAEMGEEADSDLVEVLRAGVRGYLPRRAGAQRLVEAVRALARDEAALDSAATSQLVRYLTGSSPLPCPRDRPLALLTDRQREVAELVAQGLSNEEIAGRLFLSLATVKSHLTASMRRLSVRTRTQLAILVNKGDSPAA